MSDTFKSPNKIYELSLLDGYVLEESESTINIFNKVNGYGAISITSYKIPEDYDFNIQQELKDFAASVDKNINNKELRITIDGYASSEFVIKDKYWKIWTFFKNHYAVFASYNCDGKEKNNEIDDIDRIMQSLKILH